MTPSQNDLPPAGDGTAVSSDLSLASPEQVSPAPSRPKRLKTVKTLQVEADTGKAKASKKAPAKLAAGKATAGKGTAGKLRRTRKAVRYREIDNPDEPERIAFLRRHWRSGAYTLEELQQITGLTLRQIEIIAEQEKFPKRARAKPALSRNRSHWCGKTCPGLQRCPERGVMVSRLFGAVEREIGRFERLAQDDAPSTDIRVLGALTSTLDKLFALDRDFLTTPDAEASPHAAAATTPPDPYAPVIAQRIRDAIAQALDGIGDKA